MAYLIPFSIKAQELPLEVVSYLEQLTEDAHALTQEEITEFIQKRIQHPYNLNTITRRELENFPFLTAHQIENLLEYRYDHEGFLHKYELALVEEWDEKTLRLFFPFYEVKTVEEAPSFHHFFQYIEQEAIQQFNLTAPFKEGYKKGLFLGPPVGFGIKYQLNHPLLSISMTMENDAGEPFGWQYNKGFDFYGGSICFQKIKWLQKLVLGDYKIFFGQGLVLSSSSFFTPQELENWHQRRDQIQPTYSYNETNFQRGIGCTIGMNQWEFSLIGSIKQKDLAAGNHGTYQDWLLKKGGITWGVGGNFNYRWSFLKLGASFYYNSPTQLGFFSIDYRGIWKILHYSGEIAVQTKGKVATIHTLSAQIHPAFSIGIQAHYYAPHYLHSFGKENAENSFILGEYGGKLGGKAQFKKWTLLPSFQLYRNGLQKSTSHQPAIAYQAKIQSLYQPAEQQNIQVNYTWNSKEKNKSIESSGISPTYFYHKHQIKIAYQGLFQNGLYVKAAGVTQFYQFYQEKMQFSYLIHLDMGYQSKQFKCIGRLALFDIPYFINRISLYENSIPGSSSFQSYYDTGIRAYIYGSFQLASFCKLYLKIGHTYYVHKKNIGQGNDAIHGPHVTDILFLLQWNW